MSFDICDKLSINLPCIYHCLAEIQNDPDPESFEGDLGEVLEKSRRTRIVMSISHV